MPVSTERYDLLQKKLERFTRLLHELEQGDVNAVHRTRVASRRLRELLPVLQLDASTVHKLGRRLRKVTDRLGTVRELDVLLLIVDELAAKGQHPRAALARVTADVGAERTRARTKLLAKMPVTELRRIAAKLEKSARPVAASPRASADRSQARPWRWAIDARIARRAAALSTAMAAAGPVYLPDRLHVVRIAAKKLRYAVELSVDVSPQKSTVDLAHLRRVQELLGRLHDLQVLIDRIRQIQASLTPPDLTTWRDLDGVILSLEDECRRLHGRYLHDTVALSALSARLSGRGAEPKRRRAKLGGI